MNTTLTDAAVTAVRGGTDEERWYVAFQLGEHIDKQLRTAELMRPVPSVSAKAAAALAAANVVVSQTELVPGIPVPVAADGRNIDWDAMRRVLSTSVDPTPI